VLVEINVFGDQQVSRELVRFSERSINMKPALAAVAERIQRDEDQLFESEGMTGGHGKWAPIQEATLSAKVAAGLDPRILHRTLALRESMTGGEGNIKVITNTRLQFGTRVPYALFHYKGTRTMPQRRPIDFTEPQKRGYISELQAFLIGEMRA
jgi:hypothetical protein